MTPRKHSLLILLSSLAFTYAFVVPVRAPPRAARSFVQNSEEDQADPNDSLAAELFQLAQQKGIQLENDDLMDDDEDDEDDEEEPNIPQGAINAFLGYDTGDVGEKLAGNVSLTDDQLYSEVKERVLDTAGGFVDFVTSANEEDDDD